MTETTPKTVTLKAKKGSTPQEATFFLPEGASAGMLARKYLEKLGLVPPKKRSEKDRDGREVDPDALYGLRDLDSGDELKSDRVVSDYLGDSDSARFEVTYNDTAGAGQGAREDLAPPLPVAARGAGEGAP